MSHRTRVLRLSHSTMIGLARAALDIVNVLRCSRCGWESLMKGVTLGNVTMSHRTREGCGALDAEAVYMAMASATHEALWLRQVQAELGQELDNALRVYRDNQSAITLASNDCYKPETEIYRYKLLVACMFAVAAAKPSVGVVAPVAYTAPVAAAYTAPVAAAYTAPVAYSAYSAPLAYSAYTYASPYASYLLR
ncbi:Copia protein [Eumeta japonica]|uniref:Copia protein n=1 Tax=Eumeta variegata TaxID=151549 RepID=A0A4C1VAZ5_EUMVA|nr:Copia protein [Eumeta japonica]